MRIRFTKHALERLRERNISKRDLKEALQVGIKRSGECRYKNVKGYLVVIYTAHSILDFTIITAYYED